MAAFPELCQQLADTDRHIA
jgi:hypothetical protein